MRYRFIAAAALVSCGLVATSHAALTHNYNFTTGNNTDLVTGSNATAENGATVTAGTGLTLSNGGNTTNNPGSNTAVAQYDSLGSNLLPATGSATVEEYMTATGSGFYAQEFDFNNNVFNGAAGAQYLLGVASYPSGANGGPAGTNGGSRIAFQPGTGEVDASNTTPTYLDTGSPHMVAAVIDSTANTLTYYLDGVAQDSVAIPAGGLTGFNDVNSWLGISPFTGDRALNGTIQGIRIFNDALTGSQISADYANGVNGPISEGTATPEPATLAMLGIGGVALLRRRRKVA